jgi:putative tryptophan/tyrosine transport system substrate-binding protein
MKKQLVITLFMIGISLLLILPPPRKEKQIGVIVPAQHIALEQIVQGLKEGLKEEESIHIKVLNAQNDLNLQRSIIQQLAQEGSKLLIPIGTAASQMTLALAPDRNILCLATALDITNCFPESQATSLSDELDIADSLSFFHAAFPPIKKITLFYSSSENVSKELPIFIQTAKKEGIEVQPLLVQTLSELYTAAQAIACDSGALFVLKDHLIVSGISSLAQVAEKRKIPLMACDEGSVLSGGAFAIGVKEKEIGKQGALFAQEILKGKSPREITPQTLRGPFPLFINAKACERQGIDSASLRKKAELLGLRVQFVEEVP